MHSSPCINWQWRCHLQLSQCPLPSRLQLSQSIWIQAPVATLRRHWMRLHATRQSSHWFQPNSSVFFPSQRRRPTGATGAESSSHWCYCTRIRHSSELMPNDTPIDTTPVTVTSTSVSIHPLLDITDTNPVLGITQGSVIPPHILRVLLATAEELESSSNDSSNTTSVTKSSRYWIGTVSSSH